MPKFTLQKAVPMSEVPNPTRAPRGQMGPLFEAIAALKRGSALPVTFNGKKDGLNARLALRKIATNQGETLSSSRSEDALTFYFWIEPK